MREVGYARTLCFVSTVARVSHIRGVVDVVIPDQRLAVATDVVVREQLGRLRYQHHPCRANMLDRFGHGVVRPCKPVGSIEHPRCHQLLTSGEVFEATMPSVAGFTDDVLKIAVPGQGLLALLLALARRPELIILDEPSEGLDPVAIEELLQTLQAVRGPANAS